MASVADGPPINIQQLGVRYQREFQEEYGNLLKRLHDSSSQFKEYVANSRKELRDAEKDPTKRLELGIVIPLKNFSDIGLTESMLLQSFAWITIMMLGYSIGYNMLSIVLQPLLPLLITDIQAVLLALLIIVYTYQHLNIGLDIKTRFNLLLFAIVEGAALGYVLANYHLHLPLPFIVPLVIAASAYLLAKNTKSSRVQFLAVSLLSGLLLNCAIGFLVADITFSYILTAVLYSLCALFTLQYYIEHWEQDYDKNPYAYMFSFLCIHLAINASTIFLFGSTE